MPQLFLVVSGSGWFTSADQAHHPIAAEQAAFWDGGEWHESGSDTGMMAVVIEGEGLDPARWMARLE